jgi:hypothetical protein
MFVQRLLIVSFVMALFSLNADAGIFKRTPKPDPAVQVPGLIKTLKTDPDDRKRLNAVEELRARLDGGASERQQ